MVHPLGVRASQGCDKRNFRKKILSMDLLVETDEVEQCATCPGGTAPGWMDLLVETDEVEQGVRHRAARVYRFDRRKYKRLLKQGFELSI